MSDQEVILLILEELERQTTGIRNPRGFGVGHPYFSERKTEMLGTLPFEEEAKEEQESFKKVKISKAFTK